MRVVRIEDLEEIRFLNSGSYSVVTLVNFDGNVYCYKQFKYPYSDPDTISRLCEFTDKDFPKEFLVPLYMIKDKNRITGYLSHYNKDLLDIEDCFKRNEKITLLKSTRKLLDFFHKELGYIHGDIHLGNILCEQRSLSTYLLDFDFSFKIGKVPLITDDFTEVLQYYLKHYPFDKNVDVFLFNFATLHVLKSDYEWDEELMFAISEGSYDIPEMNNDIKRLSKELLLNDIRKSYSGEYIIDYIK